jgi:hypothetical protein
LKTLKPSAAPLISLTNTKDVFVYNCFPVKGTDVFLNLKGAATSQITLKGNNFKYALQPLVKEQAVTENILVD